MNLIFVFVIVDSTMTGFWWESCSWQRHRQIASVWKRRIERRVSNCCTVWINCWDQQRSV